LVQWGRDALPFDSWSGVLGRGFGFTTLCQLLHCNCKSNSNTLVKLIGLAKNGKNKKKSVSPDSLFLTSILLARQMHLPAGQIPRAPGASYPLVPALPSAFPPSAQRAPIFPRSIASARRRRSLYFASSPPPSGIPTAAAGGNAAGSPPLPRTGSLRQARHSTLELAARRQPPPVVHPPSLDVERVPLTSSVLADLFSRTGTSLPVRIWPVKPATGRF
jgi:hypothetical protein